MSGVGEWPDWEEMDPQANPDDEPSEISAALADRLRHHVAEEDAANGSIDAKTAISRAIHRGVPASEIIDMLGGFEEVERLIGTERAELLQKQSEREE